MFRAKKINPTNKRSRRTLRRSMRVESLERRNLLAGNVGVELLDINRDGVVAPLDAISVLNNLGTENATYDTDGNGVVSPLDVLNVINCFGETFDWSATGGGEQDDHVDAIGDDSTAIDILDYRGPSDSRMVVGDFLFDYAPKARGTQIGQLDSQTDVDVFHFDLAENDKVFFFVEAMNEVPEDSLNIEIYNEEQRIFARTEATDGDAVGSISWVERNMQSGRYYATVSCAAGADCGEALSYSISAAVGRRDTHTDEIGEEATRLFVVPETTESSTASAAGAIHRAGDRDVFHFELLRNSTVTVQTENLEADDTIFRFYDETGEMVAESMGPSDSASIEIALLTGTYYVAVSSTDTITNASGNFGRFPDLNYEFTLNIERTTDHPDVIGSEIDAIDPGRFGVYGSLDPGDVDVFKLVPELDAFLLTRLRATNPAESELLLFELTDSLGDVLESSTVIPNLFGQMSRELDGGAEYYLRISRLDNALGDANGIVDYRLYSVCD